MTKAICSLCFVALLFIDNIVFAQQPVPAGGPVVDVPAKVLKEFPKEFVHEGTRLFDFEFQPEAGSVLANDSMVVVKFKYVTDSPNKVIVGAMPMVNGQPSGGYQPLALNAEKGSGEVRIFCGVGYQATKPITTLEELRASYVPIDGIEITLYSQEKTLAKIQAPLKYSVIPGAPFTVQEKFYIERLLQEVLALRKRVQELEAKVK